MLHDHRGLPSFGDGITFVGHSAQGHIKEYSAGPWRGPTARQYPVHTVTSYVTYLEVCRFVYYYLTIVGTLPLANSAIG